MEGGTDNDLLSLDQTFSSENGDKAGEGEGEKRGKDKNSESRNLCMHSHLALGAMLVLPCILWLIVCLEKPSFMVSEPTEEEKQLAEQAKEYGKMRQQSVMGEEEGAESEEPPPPGKLD